MPAHRIEGRALAQLGFSPTLVDYLPCYRTTAGTGNAMGFMHWLPQRVLTK